MPTNVSTPFEGLDLPPRTPEQKNADRERKLAQTDLLMAATGRATGQAGSSSEPDPLYETLKDRRATAASDVVRFEAIPTDTGQWSLIVPGQLLVRHGPGGALSPVVDPILARNKFTPRPGAIAEVCPDLAGRVTPYEYGSDNDAAQPRIDAMRTAMDELRNVAQASPTLVTALQQQHDQPPPQKVVAKAVVGPAPTKVDDSNEVFQEAGFQAPQGSFVVAVIDTGIALEQRQDGWLGEVERPAERIDLLDAVPQPNELLDFAAGHGTFAAGIVRMVDPNAVIRVYRALDSDGFGSESAVACAMIQAMVDGADAINLSNGMHTVDNAPSVAFQAALERIDELARELGRDAPAIVASAGNYGDTQPVWPAAFTDRVISVAALTADLEPAEWSSHGDWVTCSCVGEGIVSTFVRGTEDGAFTNPVPGLPGPDTYPLPGQEDAWAVWSGTSFAAPQIAGAITRTMREEGGIAPRAASWRLLAKGTFLPGYGKAMCLLPGT
jgi:subtilisin family serine protease